MKTETDMKSPEGTRPEKKTLLDALKGMSAHTDMTEEQRHMLIGLASITGPIAYVHDNQVNYQQKVTPEYGGRLTEACARTVDEQRQLLEAGTTSEQAIEALEKRLQKLQEADALETELWKRKGLFDVYLKASKVAATMLRRRSWDTARKLGRDLEAALPIFYKKRGLEEPEERTDRAVDKVLRVEYFCLANTISDIR